MPYLLGTDEAGYGPRLGPLVIGLSAWHVPDPAACLYAVLGDTLTADPRAAARSRCWCVCDSKQLYKPGGGLAALELGALVGCTLAACRPANWSNLGDVLVVDGWDAARTLPWHAGFDLPLPVACGPRDIDVRAVAAAEGLAGAGVRLVRLAARTIFPQEFNALVESYGNKAEVLSHVTLGLVAKVVASLPPEPVVVVCDKHGGRNRYAALLQTCFDAALVQVVNESPASSTYRLASEGGTLEFRFVAGGDSAAPAALASMAAKYLRELAMRAFNAFWQARLPGLRPTAGYPEDAVRFRGEIAAAMAELACDERLLWRVR